LETVTVFFDLSIGVIGAGADPELACMLQQHELHLAAGAFAGCLDHVVRGDPRGRHAIEDWRSRGALHPQRLQFLDVLLDRRRIASGPAGDDSLFDRYLAGRCVRLGLQRERENAR
jgi:hypothetical protein